MRLFRRILWGVVILLVLIILVSFLLPSTVHVERTKKVDAPAVSVYNLLDDIRSYDEWMPWNRKDSMIQITYHGVDTGKGASYSWTSKDDEVGSGTLTISEDDPNQKVLTSLDFGPRGNSTGGWILQPTDSGTNVTWYMDSKMTGGNFIHNVVGKYMGLFMGSMVGPDFEQGLDSLKALAELFKNERYPHFHIDTIQLQRETILYIRDTTATESEIASRLEEIYGELDAYMKEYNVDAAGTFRAWYHTASAPYVFDAGIPVENDPGVPGGRIKVKTDSACEAVIAHYWGPYELDTKGYDAIKRYIRRHFRTAKGPAYEVYVGDPGLQKDPYKVETDIIQPVE